MEEDLLSRRDAKSPYIRSRRRKLGFTAAVAAVILLGLVAIMGSLVLIWGNNFGVEQRKVGDYYSTNINRIKESLVIEDVWLSQNPTNIVGVTLRNVGDIAITVEEVKINVLDNNGALIMGCSPACTRTVTAPFSPSNSNGLIESQKTLLVDVDNIYWNHASSKSLEIFITTDRGNIIWRIYDWKGNLPTVITCNGLPATYVDDDAPHDYKGTPDDDVIVMLGGNDSVQPSAGNDTICGGDGDDYIQGGSGNDTILGENGDDTLKGENDDDLLDGGAGNDTLDGGPENDTCNGGTGTNTIVNCNP